MSLTNNSQVWLDKIDDKTLMLKVSKALREEHCNDTSKAKMICQNTGCSLHTINKWMQCKNTPKASHLLSLAGTYPLVLKALLEMICRIDIWDLCVSEKIVRKMYINSLKHKTALNIYRDKTVTINIVASIEIVTKLNHRQIWCISELQKERKIRSVHISNIWDVSSRTAKRDIARLTDLNLIRFIGAPKNGFYTLKT